MKYLPALAAALAAATAPTLHAQRLFADYPEPAFRGASGTDYAQWEDFSIAYSNPANASAPRNIGEIEPGDAGATFAQTLAPAAFITGSGSIYSPVFALGYELANSAATLPARNVVFQFETLGSAIDFSTIRLNYQGASGLVSLAPTNAISENRIIFGDRGGFINRQALQWDLSAASVTGFTITFRSLTSSNSFSAAVLDTAGTFSEVVPSARTWDGGAGTALWSAAANWSGNVLPAAGGNVTLATPGAFALDVAAEVGELRLDHTAPFQLTASGSGAFKINTGITTGNGANYAIAAPVFFGGHNVLNAGTGSTLTLAGPVSGDGQLETAPGSNFFYPAAGFLKQGAGTLVLAGNNTFTGAVSVAGGTLIVEGTNAYTDPTIISGGTLVVRGNAPVSAPGTLGNSNTNVAVGGDTAAAALLIEGAFTVARALSPAATAGVKIFGGRNTGAGATFSGAIAASATSDQIVLRAENAGDRVSFTGAVSGGATGLTLTKDGAGTVVFSGTNKTYSHATVVSAGTLEIAANTGLTGNGNLTVASGAKLLVQGSLSGSGTLVANGGTIGGSGLISRIFTLDGGDTLAPGASVGALNTVGQTWANGGRFQLELTDADATAGVGWDVVNLLGALDVSATAGGFTLELRTLTASGGAGLMQDFNSAQNYLWKFASTPAGLGVTNFAASDFTIDASGFQNARNGGSFSVVQSGNDLALRFQAVPEPSSALLLGLGALCFAGRRRPARR